MIRPTEAPPHDSVQRDLCLALIRLRVLQHASEAPVFGLGVMEDLAARGYKLSPGTLYPMLHGMEKNGLICSWPEEIHSRIRRVYRTTPLGRRILKGTKEKVRELVGDFFQEG